MLAPQSASNSTPEFRRGSHLRRLSGLSRFRVFGMVQKERAAIFRPPPLDRSAEASRYRAEQARPLHHYSPKSPVRGASASSGSTKYSMSRSRSSSSSVGCGGAGGGGGSSGGIRTCR